MLVGDGARQIRPVQPLARVAHGERQRDGLLALHAIEEDGHGKRGDLAFREGIVGQAPDEFRDLIVRQRMAVALSADDLLGQHG
jgi:hypothetical protein